MLCDASIATIMATKNTPANKTGAVAAPSLNVYKQVAVIRRPSDTLSYEDEQGTSKSVSIQELGDAILTAAVRKLL